MASESQSRRRAPRVSFSEDKLRRSALILHNDDVHSFDYVIDSLVEVCDHEVEQATQCAYLVHFKGQCDVKRGEAAPLRAMKNRLSRKGLRVTLQR
jgi:ATP-dependent Clp protease adaptor protein ClpS